jgi:uncharacterized membrane protein YdfJ with MMPL/SSD domain
MHRVGRMFVQMAFATACGLAAAEFVPITILVSSLVGLAGTRIVLKRRRSRLSQRILYFGGNASRRAA